MPENRRPPVEKPKYLAYVVPHTHWDRAWYLPFEEFRIRLVRVFDKLLRIYRTNPRFSAFTFDGQTVVLEDYLEIRPENRKVIRRLVREGKLAIGPWYVLPDEFLVSGEAVIRNLMIGHQIANQFGRVMKVGYIPDPFGHISQMPQILNGFGITSLIFSRGSGQKVRDAGLVFKWFAPDGRSSVYAILQAGMYANLGLWGVPPGEPMDTLNVDYDLALRQVHGLIDLMEKRRNPTRILLFNNGLDHTPAQPKVPEMIDHVNANQNRATLIQGAFEDFVNAVREDVDELASLTGELHEGMETGLLSGIFSTRMYLKQANAAAQIVLEKLSEPLATFAWLLGEEYPEEFLVHGWKELLKSHPHDDIGGCSVDAVHEEDMDRFRRARQVGQTISSQALGDIGRGIHAIEGRGILVYNPLSFPATGEVTLRIPLRKAALPHGPQLHDPSGRIVPSSIEWEGFSENLPDDRRSDFGELSVAFLPENVPPFGYRLYTLREGQEMRPGTHPDAELPCIENEFIRVAANADGTLALIDKQTDSTYEGLHFFEDVEDAGDEYDFSPLPAYRSVTITSHDSAACIETRRTVSYKQTLEIDLELTVPSGLTPERTARSDKTVSLPIHTTVTLCRGIRRVDFETTVENRARDHRLRVGFPTGIGSFYAFAESKFDVIRRPLRIARYTQRYYQPPASTKHDETFVDVHNGKRGFALLNRGLPEYEARREAIGVTLYQTLFRSIGWLSRPDLQTRREGAGPAIQTPGAQMLGTWTFHYSILPHRGTWEEARVWQAAHSFSVPLVAHECQPGHGDLPEELSFLSVEPPTIPVSAVKRSESREGVIVRLFNPTPREVNVSLRFFRPLASAHRVRLDETLLDSIPVSGGNRVNIPVGKKEIVTIALIPVRKSKPATG